MAVKFTRSSKYSWVKQLYDECVSHNVTFCFLGTGSLFEKDGRTYHIRPQRQREQAFKSGLNYAGKPIDFKLTDYYGRPLTADKLYKPHFSLTCRQCSAKLICNGCSDCGNCK